MAGKPHIPLTTSVLPIGVFVTLVLMATIRDSEKIKGCVNPNQSDGIICPNAAPIKNKGIMNPPFHPEDNVNEVAASLAIPAKRRNCSVCECVKISISCDSP